MQIVAVDPAYGKKIAVACYKKGGYSVCSAEINDFLKTPGGYIKLGDETPKYGVIESQWFGKNPKMTIALAQWSGRIAQALFSMGFEVEFAPAWGTDSWIKEFFHRMPGKTTGEKALTYVKCELFKLDKEFTEDEATALCLLFWKQKKIEYQKRIK